MASILVVTILVTAAFGSYISYGEIQDEEYMNDYELSLENVSAGTSYRLYVPTVYDSEAEKMDVVFEEKGEASLSHIDTEEGVLLKINGTGPLHLDFDYRGRSDRYDLPRSGWRQGGEFLIYYSSSSDCEPVLDVTYRGSSATHFTDLRIEDILDEEGWQYVDGTVATSVS